MTLFLTEKFWVFSFHSFQTSALLQNEKNTVQAIITVESWDTNMTYILHIPHLQFPYSYKPYDCTDTCRDVTVEPKKFTVTFLRSGCKCVVHDLDYE